MDTTDGGLKARLSCGSAEIERLSQRDLSRPTRVFLAKFVHFFQSPPIKNCVLALLFSSLFFPTFLAFCAPK